MVKATIESNPQIFFEIYLKNKTEQLPIFAGANWEVKILNTKSIFFYFGNVMDRKLDTYIFLTPAMPIFLRFRKIISVVFDCAFLELKTNSFQEYLKNKFLWFLQYICLLKSDKIFSISKDASIATEKFFGIKSETIEVAHIGFIEQTKDKIEVPCPPNFFLFAGVLKERKNVLNQIKAFKIFRDKNPKYSDYKLLIAGNRGRSYYECLLKYVKESGLDDFVIFLGYVKNAELSYLFGKAKALVFVSFHEGFGMPILEAYSVGLPVITSNRGAQAEVAGDCGFLADPDSPEDIATQMQKVILDNMFLQDIKDKALSRSKQFSWENFAKKISTQLY
jgi:glycosyltransferase involved in cell wall biosynthesis